VTNFGKIAPVKIAQIKIVQIKIAQSNGVSPKFRT